MAQATAFKTYNAVGNREDLIGVISNITRHETPFMSSLERVKAENTYHEWQTDTLSTAADNAQIEGADYAFTLASPTSRTGSYTQIFSKMAKVSRSQNSADHAGTDKELNYQVTKRMKEIMTDVEKALFTGTGNSGASGTARRLKGALSWITTNVETGTGTGTEVLTQDMYNDSLQAIWSSGGRPDATYVNAFQKRKVSGFANVDRTKYVEDGEKKLTNTVMEYESDFGIQKIVLNPFMDTDKVLIVTSDLWKLAVYRDSEKIDYPSLGSYVAKVVEAELTLEARNQAGNGKITGLTTA
jgi:hypothetical protein